MGIPGRHLPENWVRAAAAHAKQFKLLRARPGGVGHEPSSEHPPREIPIQAGQGAGEGLSSWRPSWVRDSAGWAFLCEFFPELSLCPQKEPVHQKPSCLDETAMSQFQQKKDSPSLGIPFPLQLKRGLNSELARREK